MSYSDQKYYARGLELVADSGVATGTFTASGSCNQTTQFVLPKFNRRSLVTAVSVLTKTAAVVGATGPLTLNFLNGTSTFAVCTVGTGTAGSVVVATPTANNTFTASGGPSVTVLGTSTASGGTLGTYEVFFEVQELYA